MSKIIEILMHQVKAYNIKASFQDTMGSLWCSTEDKKTFLKIIEVLHKLNARVCMITCHSVQDTEYELVYHFDIVGCIINIKFPVKNKTVPSITKYFKSADWSEREISEMYGIKVKNHPNPSQLFLDKSIKEQILNEYFSLSQVMSSKLSQELWQKVKQSSDKAIQ